MGRWRKPFLGRLEPKASSQSETLLPSLRRLHPTARKAFCWNSGRSRSQSSQGVAGIESSSLGLEDAPVAEGLLPSDAERIQSRREISGKSSRRWGIAS